MTDSLEKFSHILRQNSSNWSLVVTKSIINTYLNGQAILEQGSKIDMTIVGCLLNTVSEGEFCCYQAKAQAQPKERYKDTPV